MKVQQLVLAGMLTAAPIATAFAQSYGPMVGAENQRESHMIAQGSAPLHNTHHYVHHNDQRTTG